MSNWTAPATVAERLTAIGELHDLPPLKGSVKASALLSPSVG